VLAAAAAGAFLLALAFGSPAYASTTYTVNTLADNAPSVSECEGAPGDCSLRQALDRAQNGDLVVVPANASAYTIAKGAILVRGGVTVAGAGDAATTLSGGGTSQAFEVVSGPGTVTITGMTITHTYNGTGKDEGGAITGFGQDALTLEGVTISHSESPTGFGGAIEVARGEVTIRHSRFVDDAASGHSEGLSRGGAIDLGTKETTHPDTLTISDSVFVEDSTEKGEGGAISAESGATLSVSSSTFVTNIAGEGAPGGAIALFTGTTATIVNSTFTANAAGEGGAIWSEGKSLSLLGDTLAGNAAEKGANLATKITVPNGTTLENTIVATPLGSHEGVPAGNCSGKVLSNGHNLGDTSPSTCGIGLAEGDITGVNPQLGPLANNSSIDPTAGGPPQTLALAATSLAVRAGSPEGCEEEGRVDERGFPRPGVAEGVCDIGAYELLPAVPTATTLAASASASSYGQPLTFTAAVTATRPLPAAVPVPRGSVEFVDDGVSIGSATVGAGGQATLTTTALAPGTHTITALYNGDAVHASSSSAAVGESVASPPPSQQPQEPGPPAPGAPKLSHARQLHARWREGPRLASLARSSARPLPQGTSFAFALSEQATVTLTFTHTVTGRRVHGACIAQTRSNSHARACKRTATAGTMSFANVPAGARSVYFDGRLTRSKRLAPGPYTVSIVAANASGRSRAVRFTFTIVGG
jgi:hypothetical protein